MTDGDGELVVLRKARSAIGLGARLAVRAWSRSRNTIRKTGRHVSKRAVWRWKRVCERGRNGRTAVLNLGRLGLRRVMGAHKPVVRLVRRARRRSQQQAVIVEERRLERSTIRVSGAGQPVLIGPWLSEVGFEVLYWIPFLAWLKNEAGWDASRAVAVSRGGVASWYHGIADRYVEIFDHVPPDVFAAKNRARQAEIEGRQKQLQQSELDRELVSAAVAETGIEAYAPVHPSAMYTLFRHFWLGNRALSHVIERTRFEVPVAPSAFDLSGLPGEYVAVKVYAAQSLPDTPQHRALVRRLVERFAACTTVVVLDTGFTIDDHEDYDLAGNHRVVRLDRLMTPQNNLELQTQVIAGARALVGTCGSLAWRAPLMGVPTLALFADARFLRSHLYFARHAYSLAGAAPFITLDVAALDYMGVGARDALARFAEL